MIDGFEKELDLGLRDKVALVTGAAGGIGSRIAALYAAAGARVAAVDIDGDRLEAAAADWPRAGLHLLLAKDLSRAKECEDIVQSTENRFGRLDVLVNNAAVLVRAPLDSVTPELVRKTCEVNLNSQLFLSRAAAEVMKKNGGGRIVNFSSQGGYTGGYDDSIVYNMFKGAVLTLTKGLARQYGRFGICVNAITPGPVDTPMMATLPAGRLQQFVEETVLLKRMADPRELALCALFLGSAWASYITGATLDVNGGMYMR
jgi:NAD(P)-dependent dehydrogenase (short-subunit alcohol dehydrogenase family)